MGEGGWGLEPELGAGPELELGLELELGAGPELELERGCYSGLGRRGRRR